VIPSVVLNSTPFDFAIRSSGAAHGFACSPAEIVEP
jgi:hypothetical protein